MKRAIPILMSIFLLFAVSMMFAVADSSAAGESEGMAAKGTELEAAKATFEDKCSKCHGLSRPLGKKKDQAEWEQTVSRMSSYHARKMGEPILEKDQKAIVQYLTEVAGK